jgi:hypothetical protein
VLHEADNDPSHHPLKGGLRVLRQELAEPFSVSPAPKKRMIGRTRFKVSDLVLVVEIFGQE